MTQLGSGAIAIFAGVSVISILIMVSSRLHNIIIIRSIKTSFQKNKWLRYEQLLDIELFIDDLDHESMMVTPIKLHVGRIKRAFIHQLTDQIKEKNKKYGYYICGPAGYMN